MEVYKYVIVGGGLAADSACAGIRQVDPSGAVALIAAEPHLPYQRSLLSKEYLSGREGLDRVFLRDAAHYEQSGVEVLAGARAEHVDPLACILSLDDGHEIGYDRLLLATGSRARHLAFPGNDLGSVFTLRTIEDADRIRAATTASAAGRALVLGGSFIASEVAATLAQMGLSVTLAFPESRLLERVVPEPRRQMIETVHASQGVQIDAKTVVERLEGEDSVQRAVLSNRQALGVDLVVMGAGILLNTELALDAGLPLDESRAVLVDEYLRTEDPSIYAAGDIASWSDARYDKRLRVEHWDVARAQGLRAGRNMAGDLAPYTTVPYFFLEAFDLSFEAWGDISEWDRVLLRGSLEQRSFAFYYFRQGKAVGVISSGRPGTERAPMENVIARCLDYDDVASVLRDGATDLEVFAG